MSNRHGYFRTSAASGVDAAMLTWPFDGADLHSVARAWRSALDVVEEHGGRVVVCNAPSVEGPWSGAIAVGEVAENEAPPPAPPRRRASGVHRISEGLRATRERLRAMRGDE
jgi:hypothetical protein